MTPTADKKSYVLVIVIQAIYAGMFLLSKVAFDTGMNNFVFIFYRQAAATVFLAPFAFYFERKTAPPMSPVTFFKILLISFCGMTISLDIYGVALLSTTATLAAATPNCLPVITFFLAVLMRMETLDIRRRSGLAKLTGMLVCLGGATTLAFYKGPQFMLWSKNFYHHVHNDPLQHHVSSGKAWIKGCFLMLSSNFFWALWLIMQAKIIKEYPSKLLLTTIQCFLSAMQSFLIAVPFARDLDQWKLGWNVRLVSVAYCGIMVTGVTYYLQTWVIEKRGPVFLAMSTPLALIITMLISGGLLQEAITLGSILGGLLLICGLYSVIWGKSREEKDFVISCPMDEKEVAHQKEGTTMSHRASPVLMV